MRPVAAGFSTSFTVASPTRTKSPHRPRPRLLPATVLYCRAQQHFYCSDILSATTSPPNNCLNRNVDKWFATTLGDIRRSTRGAFEDLVQGRLSAALSFRAIRDGQQQAWRVSASWVWNWASTADAAPNEWLVLFEYATPLVTSRPDVVVVGRNHVMVLEFKTGESTPSSAKRQTLGYAEDLYWFHPGAKQRSVIPVLVTPSGNFVQDLNKVAAPDILPNEVLSMSVKQVSDFLQEIAVAEESSSGMIYEDLWVKAQYRPRPSIIDAAVALFAQNEDPGINTSIVDDDELDQLTKFLVTTVHDTAVANQHRVLLISGVPGAGKTLVGLRLAYDQCVVKTLRKFDSNPLYLTGNGPLVQVLTEALARDFARRNPGTTLSNARKKAGTLVKLVHSFTREGLSESNQLDVPHVAIFDEGQRVWNASQMASKHTFSEGEIMTEPEVILKNLEKQDWAVVVVLIGDGQEINTGEAGVGLWVDAAKNRSQLGDVDWKISGSDQVPRSEHLYERTNVLFLGHSRRSQGASWLSTWVSAVINGDSIGARNVFEKGDYPVFVTRDLAAAKDWLRQVSGRGRFGLVASAHAGRLRPYGIEMNTEFQAGIDWRNWFLDRPPSLESCSALEVAASEFKCQGLELDYTGVCWSWDLIRSEDDWTVRSLRSRNLRWATAKGDKKRFGLNAYRVLLTRARAGMIIWIPEGDRSDPTRNPDEMNGVSDFLIQCGVTELHQLEVNK